MDLTDAQWAVLQPLLELKRPRQRGRPWREARAVLTESSGYCGPGPIARMEHFICGRPFDHWSCASLVPEGTGEVARCPNTLSVKAPAFLLPYPWK